MSASRRFVELSTGKWVAKAPYLFFFMDKRPDFPHIIGWDSITQNLKTIYKVSKKNYTKRAYCLYNIIILF